MLLGQGHDVDAVRKLLEEAGERLRSPRPYPRFLQATLAHQPLVLAAGAFGVWTLGALLVQAVMQCQPWVAALLVGAGAAPAGALYWWTRSNTALLKRTAVREYPARLCRHYAHAYESAVADYERTVNRFAVATVPAG